MELPVADELPGTDRPTVSVAIDSSGRLYYENQVVEENQLRTRLNQAAKASAEPLTLLVHADKAVPYERVVQVSLLARQAGIGQGWLATLPRPMAPAR